MASIYLRGNVYWVLYYENGRKIQRSLRTRDRTAAKQYKTDVESRLYRGTKPFPNLNIHIDRILEEYEIHCTGINKAKTVTDDIGRIQSLISWIGAARANDLNEAAVRGYINHRIKADKISHETANRIITNAKTFLNFALRQNYIGENPLKAIRKYAVDRLPPRFLSKEEINAVLAASEGNPARTMVVTAIYTGLRFGELKRLTWADIDFARNQVIIRISKSGKFRAVPLHPELKKILISVKGDKTKQCFDCKNLRRLFRRICIKSKNFEEIKRAGARPELVPTIGWHTFRHTFASHLVMSGLDLVTVGKYLGHSNIKTTMIYSHLSPEHMSDGITRLQF